MELQTGTPFFVWNVVLAYSPASSMQRYFTEQLNTLASVLSTKPLQLLVEHEHKEKLPSVDHGPLKEGAVGKRTNLFLGTSLQKL